MTTTKKKLLLPSTMAQAGRAVLEKRSDVEAISYDASMPAPAFHALLAEADGVAPSPTPFGEAEVNCGLRLWN